MSMRIGSIIYVFYDCRPWQPHVDAYKCQIVKETKTGYKFKNLDKPGKYEDVILYRNGRARGWDTITWETQDQGESDYNILRVMMSNDERQSALEVPEGDVNGQK